MKDMTTVQKRKRHRGYMKTRINVEIKPCNSLHVKPIGSYVKSVWKQQLGGFILPKEVWSFTCLDMIDPDTIWFKTTPSPLFDINEVSAGN